MQRHCLCQCAQSRFYELQNKRLEKEIAELKENMGRETTRIKKMYEAEIGEVKTLLERANGERDHLEDRLRAAEQAARDLDTKCASLKSSVRVHCTQVSQ